MDVVARPPSPNPSRALGGTLDAFPIGAVLRLLERSRNSGRLLVDSSPPTAIWVRGGQVSLAAETDLMVLRPVLAAAAVLDGARLDSALTVAAADGNSLAAALFSAGAARGAVTEVLWDRTVETIFELLLPSKHEFWFEPDVAAQNGAPAVSHPLTFDVQPLLDAAADRLSAWRVIAQRIPSTSCVVRLVEDLPSSVDLVTISREEWPILAAIDGQRDIAGIIGRTGLSAFGVCGVLHHLLQIGVIAVSRR